MDRYLDGELLPEKIHAFEDHLRTCIHCRRVLEEKRQQRRMRVSSLMPAEIPISTEEIFDMIQEKWPSEEPAKILPFPYQTLWWEKIKTLTFQPAPALALALCIIALGLSFFLPFGSHKELKPGIVIEEIESTRSFMIYQPKYIETTVIWIVPTKGKKEAI